jgi:pimeloyl-ACP methyl ester carboxylesterase
MDGTKEAATMPPWPENVPLRLLTLHRADGHLLEGALYQPEGATRDVGLVFVHGKGENFYSGPGRWGPPHLVAAGYPCLALNMRCHDIAYTRADVPFFGFERDDPLVDGGAFERLTEGKLDVAAAVDYLRAHGTPRVVVVGHSSGGFYAADYAATDPQLAGVALLSPVVSNQRALDNWFADPQERSAVVARARELVAAGQGHQLITVPRWFQTISAASLVEREEERPGWFVGNLERLRMPVLMLYGDQETRAALWTGLLERVPSPRKELAVVPSEHSYIGAEVAVAEAIRAFVARHVES